MTDAHESSKNIFDLTGFYEVVRFDPFKKMRKSPISPISFQEDYTNTWLRVTDGLRFFPAARGALK